MADKMHTELTPEEMAQAAGGATPIVQWISYTTVSGDTLKAVANRFGTSPNWIRVYNVGAKAFTDYESLPGGLNWNIPRGRVGYASPTDSDIPIYR